MRIRLIEGKTSELAAVVFGFFDSLPSYKEWNLVEEALNDNPLPLHEWEAWNYKEYIEDDYNYNTYLADTMIGDGVVTFVTGTSKRVVTVTESTITVDFGEEGSKVAANSILRRLKIIYPEANVTYTTVDGMHHSIKDYIVPTLTVDQAKEIMDSFAFGELEYIESDSAYHYFKGFAPAIREGRLDLSITNQINASDRYIIRAKDGNGDWEFIYTA